MARPSKATVDYFPHIIKNGKTIYILENKFKNDGYACWFKVLEMLGDAENHFIDCNNKGTWEYLIARMLIDEERVISILDTLASLSSIDAELWSKKIIWSRSFIDNVKDAYKRRNVQLPSRDEVIAYINSTSKELLYTETPVKGTDVDILPQSIVKESIVKESILLDSNESFVDTKVPTPLVDEEEKDVEKKESLSKATEVDLQLARFLAEKILAANDAFEAKYLNEDGTWSAKLIATVASWARHIERMRRLDKRTPLQIEGIIYWIFGGEFSLPDGKKHNFVGDTFWQSNCMSAETLRKKYDTIYGSCKRYFQNLQGKQKTVEMSDDGSFSM